MSKLRFNITMSLDGFVAGPKQSEQDPLDCGLARAVLQQLQPLVVSTNANQRKRGRGFCCGNGFVTRVAGHFAAIVTC